MNIHATDELIRLRTEERSQILEKMKWARTNVGLENARCRLCELNEELAQLQRQKTHLMESAA